MTGVQTCALPISEPARDVIIVADGGGGVPPLHDVVGVPTFGLGFDRAPETGQRRSIILDGIP